MGTDRQNMPLALVLELRVLNAHVSGTQVNSVLLFDYYAYFWLKREKIHLPSKPEFKIISGKLVAVSSSTQQNLKQQWDKFSFC